MKVTQASNSEKEFDPSGKFSELLLLGVMAVLVAIVVADLFR
jgi:hypothetical protein